MAQRTYSMLGKVQWWDFGVEVDIFFVEFAAKPMTARRHAGDQRGILS